MLVPRPSMETTPRVDDLIALPDGRSLAYAEFGDPDGRPVLFFHGTPGYRLNPWTTDAELRSLGVRLIALDRPGVGRSTRRRDRRCWTGLTTCRYSRTAWGSSASPSSGSPTGGRTLPRARTDSAHDSAARPSWPRCRHLTSREHYGNWASPAGTTRLSGGRRGSVLFGALAGRNPARAERILLSNMSEPDRQLFARPEFEGRFG